MIRRVGRIGGALVGGAALFVGYDIYKSRNPPDQLPFDPKLKTVCILGTGWAATSILKDIDTTNLNVVVVSPRNYFLFTPLLPSCTVGTADLRSIMQPIRYFLRFKKRQIAMVEGECTNIDPIKKQLVVEDNSLIKANVSSHTLKYDYLVIACGSENATFGIPGVAENSCFLKEAEDAKKIRQRLMDAIETAAFPGQDEDEVNRLLSMVVVGGGPTGVEYAAELYDFLVDDLLVWYPDLAPKLNITLIEAMPRVLPMFNKTLIEYTEKLFKERSINVKNNTAVKQVNPTNVIVEDRTNKETYSVPFGLLVWAAGNKPRPLISNLIKDIGPEYQDQRRGLVVDDFLKVQGANDIFALGDATATRLAPTAQVAAGQGRYLAKFFNLLSQNDEATIQKFIGPFSYDHLGSLAYIGGDRAIADFSKFHFGGMLTFWFWRSAYLTNLLSTRNRILVAFDWTKNRLFGRDISRE